MALPSAADLAVFYNTAEFAAAATYTPPGGPTDDVTIILDVPDERDGAAGNAQVMVPTRTARVRVSEIAAPARNAVIAVTSPVAESFKLRSWERTKDGAEWILNMAAQS